MAVTREEVKKVAYLAKLDIPEEDIDGFTEQFNKILGYVDTLNELDTENVQPTSHVLDLANVYREDVVVPPVDRDTMLSNAPQKADGLYRVPKVVSK